MKKSTKSIWAVVVIILVIVAIFVFKGLGSDRSPTQKQIIKIGYIAPLSGNVAFLGQGVKSAAELALKEVNARNTKYEYQIIFEDDAFSPARTASAANKLISIDKVDAIVTVASPAGGSANPIAEKSKIIHVGIASDPTIAKGEYNFINWTPPAEEVKTFIGQLNKRGIKKLAVFAQNISGITAVTNELKKQIVGTDIQIVSEDVTNLGDKDFRTSIQKAKSANPDYILLVMFSPELEIVTKQIRDFGIKTPLTAMESFELSDTPGIFEGLWYVNGADATKKFADAFMSAYGKSPSIAAPNSYDILGLIVAAAESFDGKIKPSSTDLAHALAQVKGYTGALGSNISVGPDHVVVTKAVVRIIKDGKPVTIPQ